MNRRSITGSIAALAAAAALFSANPACAQRYTVTDLGKENIGWAANNYGQVAGYDLNNPNFLWTPTAAGGTFGSAISVPTYYTSINAGGQMIGSDAGGPLVWTPTVPNGASGSSTHLSSLLPANSGWAPSSVACINDAGSMFGAGTYTDASGTAVSESFFWQKDAAGNVVMTSTAIASGYPTSMNNIPSPQFVTGVWIWQNGVATNLSAQYNPAPGTPFLENRSINDLGQVAGQITTTSGPLHAFAWTPDVPNGTTSTYGVQDLHPAGYYQSYARGINNAGQVVGTASTTSSLTTNIAVLWDSSGWHNLNSMCNPLPTGWNLIIAYGINNRTVNDLPAGQITGRAFVTVTTTTTTIVHKRPVTTTTISSENHGFLLTPQ